MTEPAAPQPSRSAPAHPVRTRIAPSPTGFLHLGTARTALYAWAFARHHGGAFVLRIEDTDVERSTQASVDQILQAMRWLGLDWDEGPIHQMDRLDRYHAVAARMLAEGTAYRCWCTPAELEAMREHQRARGILKTQYDGRWRPEPGKVLPAPPPGVQPVVRFANPKHGEVVWDDLVKGEIRIANAEFDDPIILRPAADDAGADAFGVPTYNFAVVVDDLDMGITHVLRGDEHVNNTPWQINIAQALIASQGGVLPRYGHCPVILDDTGQKLSKRRGAVSVTAYEEAGFLPEAMLNYLARLGWSHGDDELFTRGQFVHWFDGSHLQKAPARWDAAKLAWVNAQHLKRTDDARLVPLVADQLRMLGASVPPEDWLLRLVALFKDRVETTRQLAEAAQVFATPVAPSAEDAAAHLGQAQRAALAALRKALAALGPADWQPPAIQQAMKAVLAQQGLKMPQLAMPLRVALLGRPHSPSIDAVVALFDREEALRRLDALD